MADKYAVDRFVLVSTDKAVNPTSVMGASKRVAEMIIQAIDSGSETRFMAVRFGNVLGSNGSVIPYFKQQIASREPVTVTHSDIKRYFMTIPEAAQLVIQAGALGQGGEVFVLDMGEPIKIVDLAKDLIRLSGLEPGEDIEIVITGLRPGEKLYEELLHKNEDIATEHEKIYITNLEKIDVKGLTKGLDILDRLVKTGNREEIIGYLKEIVPTYGSDLESTWEQEKEVAASKK
jgi:FlaA1/EpsC-like NDP-sugar epimerase